jgi:hypothetical protein
MASSKDLRNYSALTSVSCNLTASNPLVACAADNSLAFCCLSSVTCLPITYLMAALTVASVAALSTSICCAISLRNASKAASLIRLLMYFSVTVLLYCSVLDRTDGAIVENTVFLDVGCYAEATSWAYRFYRAKSRDVIVCYSCAIWFWRIGNY